MPFSAAGSCCASRCAAIAVGHDAILLAAAAGASGRSRGRTRRGRRRRRTGPRPPCRRPCGDAGRNRRRARGARRAKMRAQSVGRPRPRCLPRRHRAGGGFRRSRACTGLADHVLMNPPFNGAQNPSPDRARRLAHVPGDARTWLGTAAAILPPGGRRHADLARGWARRCARGACAGFRRGRRAAGPPQAGRACDPRPRARSQGPRRPIALLPGLVLRMPTANRQLRPKPCCATVLRYLLLKADAERELAAKCLMPAKCSQRRHTEISILRYQD